MNMNVIEPVEWVVYRVPMTGRETATRIGVCLQNEWDAMQVARPGFHTLIREHIRYEGEAEQLAREIQFPPKPKTLS